MKDILQFYKKVMNAKGMLKSTVVRTQPDSDLDCKVLIMDLQGFKGVIKEDEVDAFRSWKSLVRFVGQEVNFIIEEIDEENETIYCSRKKAQEMLEEDIINKLNDGEELDAKITGFVKYGAYVSIEGIYALLHNVDFSDDYIPVSEVHNIGDKIKVKLNKKSTNNRLTVEPVEKYVATGLMSFDSFEKDQVVLGKIVSIKPWGVYVNIGRGVDALCSMPETFDIEEGLKVSFRITVIKPEEKKIRGKILRLLG